MQAYAEARALFQQAGDRIGEADALLMIGLLSVNEDNIAATAMLIRAGRLYRAVGAIQWHRKALTLAQRVR